MKLLVTILVALFCVAVKQTTIDKLLINILNGNSQASFETKTTPRISLNELLLSIPLREYDENIVKYERAIKCIQGVMDASFADADLKTVWEDTKSKADQLRNVDLKECLNVKDAEEHKK